MEARGVSCRWERHAGNGAGGTLLYGTLAEQADLLRERYLGRMQCIYLDPPFFTGQRFCMRMRIGDQGWEKGKPAMSLPAYRDRW